MMKHNIHSNSMEIRTVVITKKFIIRESKTDIKDYLRKGFKVLKPMTKDQLTVEGSKIQI